MTAAFRRLIESGRSVGRSLPCRRNPVAKKIARKKSVTKAAAKSRPVPKAAAENGRARRTAPVRPDDFRAVRHVGEKSLKP